MLPAFFLFELARGVSRRVWTSFFLRANAANKWVIFPAQTKEMRKKLLRGLRVNLFARVWSGRRRRLRQEKRLRKFLFFCAEFFLPDFFCFCEKRRFFCCNEVTKPRNTRCGGILRPKKEKTYWNCALKGRLNIFIM